MSDDKDYTIAMFLFFIAFGLAVAIAAVGCAHAPPPVPLVETKVVTVPVKVRCATTPPPKFKSVEQPTVCPDGKHLCLTPEAAANLVEDVERLQEWVAITWGACAPDGVTQ